MRTDSQGGLLVFSIDCELHAASAQLEVQREVRQVVSQTLELFDRHQVAATWSVSDPATSWLRDEMTNEVRHELAVYAGSEWIGRSRFARQLADRCRRALALEMPLTTLVSRCLSPTAYSELLNEHLISVIRGDSPSHFSLVKPSQLRSGLTSLPASCQLPGRRTWLGDRARRQARCLMRLAAEQQQICHIAVDCQQLATGKGADSIRTIVELAARMRANDELKIATMCDAASQLSGLAGSRPSHSILRAA